MDDKPMPNSLLNELVIGIRRQNTINTKDPQQDIDQTPHTRNTRGSYWEINSCTLDM